MDHEDPHIDPAKPDLGDSIDDLLDELDTPCADDESLVEADAETNLEEPAGDESPEDNSEKNAVVSETLNALDSVSQAAELLLGDSIDELLDDEPEIEAEDSIDNLDETDETNEIIDVEELSNHFDKIDNDILGN